MRRVPRVSSWLAAPLLLAACGETPTAPQDAAAVTDVVAADAPRPDVLATDAATPTDVVAADVRDVPAADVSDAGAGCALNRVLVTTSDFVTAGFAIGPRAAMGALMTPMVPAPDTDHVPVESGCVVYNLLRGNDILAVLDLANLPASARRVPLRSQIADAGPSMYQANPYDVLTLSATKAYVAQLGLPRLAIVDPTRDGAAALTGSVDLSPLRSPMDVDANGSPEPMRVLRVGARALVGLQNLSAFSPVAPGTIAVIDTATDQLVDLDAAAAGVQGVTLTARNPVAMTLTPSGARVVTAGAGMVAFTAPQALDGAIEAIDAMTLRPTGMRVTEATLGGDVGAMVMLDDDLGWAVVTVLPTGDAGARVERIVEFSLATGAVTRTVFSGTSIFALARDPDGNVWVADRSPGAEALRVFSPNGMQRTPAPTTGALPPYGIAFVP